MRATWGWAQRIGTAATLFAVLGVLAGRLYPFAIREGYRICESVGLMDPGGALGGQIAGFTFQREPEWAHWVVRGAAGVVCWGPGLALALAVATPGVVGPGPTVCGRCGGAVRRASGPECPACGEAFA